ncbi:MAG: cysteine desulfurase family protein [Anaerolineales bacterium]
MERIYLDYAATTPLDGRVLEAMLPYFSQVFGNPSSVHFYGQQSEGAIEEARERIAILLNAQPQEIIFTSGGSESDNLALRGVARARRLQSGAYRILTAPTEHPAVAKTAQALEREEGFQVTWLDVDEYGIVHPEAVKKALDGHVALVSIMYANNEIGSINPIAEIAAVCRAHGVPFHTDAVQAAAFLPVDVQALGVDLLSLGAHKFYGPKGVGVLYVRRGTPLLPVQTGGGQEEGRRAGTHNVPYIVGMAKALELAIEERASRREWTQTLRDRLISYVLEHIPDSRLTGHPIHRLPHHASFVFKGTDGNTLLQLLDAVGIACSSGSACKSGNPQPSEVLLACGLPPEWALGSLRITLGVHTTSQEVDTLLARLPDCVEQARALQRQTVTGGT